VPKTDPYAPAGKLRPQAGFYAWGPNFASPSGFIPPGLGCAVTFAEANVAEFCDPTVDREITRARSLQTSDAALATSLWTQIDRQITWKAPWVPYANGVVLEVVSSRVGNYQYNPQWGTLLDQLWVY